jgi:hypothetical protein
MKKIILILITINVALYADLSIKQMDDMIVNIHKKREGIKLGALEHTQTPFIEVKIEDNVTKPIINAEKVVLLELHTILNNKAYINDKWYNLDDSIAGYSLKFIGKKGVVLRNENSIKKLFLHKNKNNFLMISEGK